MGTKKGLFIVFEGCEGSGKTTQIKLLKKYLLKKGKEVILTKEPGGTPEGAKIREILLNPKNNLTPKAELFLFEADRDIHINNLILPALHNGKIVISDRYDSSTFAYQSVGRKLPNLLVKNVNHLVVAKCRPNLIFVLKIDVKEGLKRAKTVSGKGDRFEDEEISFHEKIQESYLKQAEENPEKFKVINGNRSILKVHKDIVIEVEKLFETQFI